MPPLRNVVETTRTVTTPDGAALRVHARGPEDAPLTVVLAHGWTLTADTWRSQATALVSGRLGLPCGAVRVISWEQRGHGGSTLGGHPLSVDLLGEDLAHVIDASAPSGPVVLGGHSMGGMTIMALAAARPGFVAERVAGVALVSTSAGHLDTGLPGHPLRARVAAACRRGLMDTLVRFPERAERLRAVVPPRLALHRAAVGRLLFGPGADPLWVRDCAELVHATPADVIGAFYPALMAHDKIWRLRALREVPVSILSGTADRLTPVRHARALARALPGARLEVLPGRGHMLPLEAADVVGDHLARLCREAADGSEHR
ncbi:pimeloyl-ACP methyl ester carboxylesterase [Spinactinospora alkalitolerans]|uniref:Pimeloyl-ACP methyl ester carboxylesterase n=1 Tax=Spinactinospora alkalitolerans TaxID=687207 RepID=A0A852U5H0_9ACTN|nr:alpha/beta hydrolase [Spinactinospora alkalitolerans]NYE49324.1 pimeloyl-ACP methyl ester carboxylesterase [Spinactinospora alkalitolerans]